MVSGGIRTSAKEGQAQASRNQGLTDFLFWAHTGKGAPETAGLWWRLQTEEDETVPENWTRPCPGKVKAGSVPV